MPEQRAHVVMTRVDETPLRGLKRQIAAIALATEVREIRRVQMRSGNLREKICRGLVRQMTMPAHNALLEISRPLGIAQHFLVVIGLDHHHPAITQVGSYQRCGHPGIGYDPDSDAGRDDHKSNGLAGIVGNREGFNRKITDRKRLSGRKQPAPQVAKSLLLLQRLDRAAIRVDRNLMPGMHEGQTGDVIRMLVTDANPLDLIKRTAGFRQPLRQVFQRQTGVNQ